jgi:SAM-dependent methyltransferase
MMNRALISNMLRSLRLIYVSDHLRFVLQRLVNTGRNRRFRVANPGVALPPDYLMYESFGLDYAKYYTDSRATAEWLLQHFRKYVPLDEARILDWGCGPGRIIRHLPGLCTGRCEIHGTDYNPASIAWCRAHLQGVSFNLNTSEASLPYSNDYFDVIYGISIFTHLSEGMHQQWFAELYRILKPGGIMFLTMHGRSFRVKLGQSELQNFDAGKLVIRGRVKEGHRTYTAFHPLLYLQSLFARTTVLEHVEAKEDPDERPQQDIWILRK